MESRYETHLFFFVTLCILTSDVSFSDVYVGFGQREITPQPGIPSAGYFLRRGKGMKGTHDPLLATALTLKTEDLDFVQFLASRSRGSALQIVYFFAKFIAKGAIYERRNKQFASDSLGDAAIKLYKVEEDKFVVFCAVDHLGFLHEMY